MASQFKKKLKPGLIELDPEEPVIIVNFVQQTVDTSQEGEDGKPLVVEAIQDAKRMRLKTFTVNSTIQKFAEAIQKQTPLIHESKIPHIVELLTQLRQRMLDAGEGGADLSATAPAPLSMARTASQGPAHSSNRDLPPANIDVRASAPARGYSEQQRRREEEEEQQREREQQPEENQLRQSGPVRPSSAARQRAPIPQQQQQQQQEEYNNQQGGRNGPGAPKPSQSPTFGNRGEEQYNNNGANPNQKSQKGREPVPEIPRELTPEEEEALEHEREMKRLREEKIIKEQRKARFAKKAESALQVAFNAEKERLALVEKRESARKKKEREKERKKENASLKKLEEYIETLYEEDMNDKIRGTSLILQLVQNPENLDHFIDNDTVLGALARVLNEDRKKSTELITNILEIFFCFSSFRQLHPILLQNKIGDTTMKIIDLEIKRYEMRREKEEVWRREFAESTRNAYQLSLNPSKNPQGDITTQYINPNQNISSDEKERYKKLTTFLQSQEKLLFVCFYILLNLAEDFHIELKMKNRKIIKHLVKMLNRTGAPYVEDRMFLDELHLLIITFLKKLSIFEENKKEMKEYDIVKSLAQFIQNNHASNSAGGASGMGSSSATDQSNPEVLDAVLKLLYNLSFDSDMKREISLVCGGIGGGWVIPKNFGKANQSHAPIQLPMSPGPNNSNMGLVVFGNNQFNYDKELNVSNLIVRCADLLKKPNGNVRLIAARVLYNLSSDLNYRPLVERVLYPDISILSNLILRCQSKLVDKELISLAVNVTWNEEIVDAMITPEIFYSIIKRVHQTFDPLLIKLLRNISHRPEQVPLFKKFLHELVGMTLKAPSHEFLVESIGILANLTLTDVLYSELIAQHGLLDFLMTHLQPGFADDDIVLECVQLLGTLAIDPKAAPMLANGHLIRNMFELLNEKIEDLDIVVHIVFTIFKFLLHKESREAIMMHAHLTNCLLDLVVDPSPEVRHLANMCLDIIMEHDDMWREKIRSKRFEAFNREWLQFIAQSTGGDMHMHHEMGDHHGHHLLPGESYDHSSLGLHHHDDSMGDDSQDGIHHGGPGGGYGGYSHHGELGDSNHLDLDHYRHEQDSLDDSEDLSARR